MATESKEALESRNRAGLCFASAFKIGRYGVKHNLKLMSLMLQFATKCKSTIAL
jgi:hypothetical protein